MTDEMLDALNRIINSAVEYGGDPGGPYCMAKGWVKLQAAVQDLLSMYGVADEYELVESSCTDFNYCELRKKV